MNKIKTACALLLILAVSACSSGGGGSATFALSNAPGAGGGTISTITVANILAEVDRLEEEINAGSLAAATIPTAGSATLNGYVGVGNDENFEVAFGHLTIEADFGDSTLTTEATDFRTFNTFIPGLPIALSDNDDDQIASGTLSGDGTITGTTMTSGLNGILTNVGGNNIGVTSTLDGDFHDDDDGRLVVYGDVDGTAVFSDGDTLNLEGNFAVSE